jgi:hypothetical protein
MVVSASSATYMDQNTYTAQGEAQRVRRERNLDHWDSDTLAVYLDEYQGFDVAIMFYAQWDSNSRALAPYWDRIATTLDAGNERSRLVMALFDCELNVAHSELCHAAGITHYPTLLFVGSGPYHDTDPLTKTLLGAAKSAGVMGEAPVPNTVKFQGNWNYVDSITDWIRTMQALSNWHTWTTEGFGKRLRNFFLPQKPRNSPLPIGVPGGGGGAGKGVLQGAATTIGAGLGGGGTDNNSLKVKTLESQVEQLSELTANYEKAVERSSSFLDTILLGNDYANDGIDMFTLLNNENAWEKSNRPTAEVLRHCVTELSLDYCQRMSQKAANDLVDSLSQQGMSVEEMLALPDLEQLILDRVAQTEPYCVLLDNCIVTDFAGAECRPATCPFQNPLACQYLTSCFGSALQEEYANVLGFSLVAAEEPEADDASTTNPEAGEGGGKKRKWGF